jgi:hypothetical protein
MEPPIRGEAIDQRRSLDLDLQLTIHRLSYIGLGG